MLAQADKINKADPTLKVKLDAKNLGVEVAALKTSFEGLSKLAQGIKIGPSDKGGIVQLRQVGIELGKIQNRFSKGFDVSGINRTGLAIDRLAVKVDKLNKTSDRPGGIAGFLSGLGGGKGGGWLGNAAGGAGGFLSKLPQWAQRPAAGVGGVAGAGILGGAAVSILGIVSGLIEAAIPTLLGAGIGALGVSQLSGTHPKQFKTLGSTVQATLQGALAPPTAKMVTGPGHPQWVQTGETGFLQSVNSILKQIGSFVGTQGFALRDMFQASIPYLKMFVSVGEQAAKIMLPAFTQTLRTMAPFLPTIAKGMTSIVQGFAGFLKALGPQGMKAGAQVFADSAKVIEGLLIALGKTLSFLSILSAESWHAWRVGWDDTRHYTAVAFDDLRHALASFGDYFANRFILLGHTVEHAWDMMWQNVVARIGRGASDVGHGFMHVWDSIWGQVRHWPQWLYNLGASIVTELWHGAESVGGSVVSWFTHLGGTIIGDLKGIFQIHSPSGVMFDMGKNLVLGLHNGVMAHMPMLGGGIKAMGNSVVGWISQALKIAHAPAGWLGALETLVSKESGGNPNAFNPTSVGGQHATGLFQTLPSTFAAYSLGGSITNPVADAVAGIRYIMSRYGSPFNIPGLLGGNYVGYAKGGWINEPVMGVGMRSGTGYTFGESGPEYVSAHGSGGINVTVNASGLVNPDAIAAEIWMSLRDLKRHRKQDLGLA